MRYGVGLIAGALKVPEGRIVARRLRCGVGGTDRVDTIEQRTSLKARNVPWTGEASEKHEVRHAGFTAAR